MMKGENPVGFGRAVVVDVQAVDCGIVVAYVTLETVYGPIMNGFEKLTGNRKSLAIEKLCAPWRSEGTFHTQDPVFSISTGMC
jgi:hypothetical protein